MDITSAQARQKFNIEGIKEVKVSLEHAKEATKKDGINEVFFTAGDKQYVAYGNKMDVLEIVLDSTETKSKFNGSEIKINFTDSEVDVYASTNDEKAEKGATIGLAVGTLGTAVLGLLAGPGSGLGLAHIVMHGAIGAGLGFGIGYGVGAIQGAFKTEPDYKPLNQITK